MSNFWEGFRIVDAGSLLCLLIIVFWWIRQFNKGSWHTDKEFQEFKNQFEKRLSEVKASRDALVADAQKREIEWREIAKLSNEAATVMRSQLTTVVDGTMHAISPSAHAVRIEAER